MYHSRIGRRKMLKYVDVPSLLILVPPLLPFILDFIRM